MISTNGYKQQHVMCDTVSLDTRQTTLLYLVVYIYCHSSIHCNLE